VAWREGALLNVETQVRFDSATIDDTSKRSWWSRFAQPERVRTQFFTTISTQKLRHVVACGK
jgi:hypothetical protein